MNQTIKLIYVPEINSLGCSIDIILEKARFLGFLVEFPFYLKGNICLVPRCSPSTGTRCPVYGVFIGLLNLYNIKKATHRVAYKNFLYFIWAYQSCQFSIAVAFFKGFSKTTNRVCSIGEMAFAFSSQVIPFAATTMH